MLKKRDLLGMYSKVAGLHVVFEKIVNNNNRLEGAYYRENPQALMKRENKLIEEVDSSKKLLTSDERYILYHIEHVQMKNLIIALFQEMIFYKFNKVSSVPRHVHLKHLTNKYSRYDIFDKVTLYQHTLNCAICAIEVCEKESAPNKIRENIILLSILHDFGKSTLLLEKLLDTKTHLQLTRTKIPHNIYSALYAETFLKNYIGEAIQKETYLVIIQTLKDHHNEYAEDTLWLKLLRLSDFLAKDKEEQFGASLSLKGEV